MTSAAGQHTQTISPIVTSSVAEWMSDSPDDKLFETPVKTYARYVWKKWLFMFVCLTIAFVVMGLALTLGTYHISFTNTYVTIWNHFTGHVVNETYDRVIFDLRLPRICVGAVAGAGLAVAGAAMQSTLKNPLADPYTTGVSAGASLGATLAIAVGFTIIPGGLGLIGNAFIFALIPTAIMVVISRHQNASPTTMIMAGIAVMYLFNAITTLVKMWSSPDDLQALYFWEVGSLGSAKWDDLLAMLPIVMAGIIVIQLLSRQLNVIAAGDDNAKALGVNAKQLRTVCLLVVALMTASIVSFTGLIGFVGLIAPHVVRIIIGADNRYLVTASAVFGIALLLAADLIGRTILAPTIIQVGVVMAFLGGPMFLYLILRKNTKVWG
ncbi:MAG: iron ABC transporter permease [Candidatus Methanomethylophilus sp.]|nr:iron ABC transporter permease [Methanomethylophilus sp.]